MSRNRAIRQESLEDELSGYMTRMTDWTQRNGRNVLIGAAVVLVAVVAAFLIRSSSAGNEKSAAIDLAAAATAFNQNQTEAAATKLNEVIQRYGSTRSGNRARLLMGDVELMRGNAAAAEAQFRAFLSRVKPEEYIWANGQRGRAVALEDQGKYAEAAEAYASLLKAPLGEEEQARALLDAARAKSLAGDSAGAKALYDRIVKEFPSSRAVSQAKLHRAEMEAAGAR